MDISKLKLQRKLPPIDYERDRDIASQVMNLAHDLTMVIDDAVEHGLEVRVSTSDAIVLGKRPRPVISVHVTRPL